MHEQKIRQPIAYHTEITLASDSNVCTLANLSDLDKFFSHASLIEYQSVHDMTGGLPLFPQVLVRSLGESVVDCKSIVDSG